MKPLADRFLELPEPHSLRKEIAELIRALDFYASCPPNSGLRESIINGGEYRPMGEYAREALANIKERLDAKP